MDILPLHTVNKPGVHLMLEWFDSQYELHTLKSQIFYSKLHDTVAQELKEAHYHTYTADM